MLNLLEQGSQPPSLAFGRDLEAGRGEGKFSDKKKRKVSGILCRFLKWGSWMWAN